MELLLVVVVVFFWLAMFQLPDGSGTIQHKDFGLDSFGRLRLSRSITLRFQIACISRLPVRLK